MGYQPVPMRVQRDSCVGGRVASATARKPAAEEAVDVGVAMRDYLRAIVALVVWTAAAVILLWAACSTVIKGVGWRW